MLVCIVYFFDHLFFFGNGVSSTISDRSLPTNTGSKEAEPCTLNDTVLQFFVSQEMDIGTISLIGKTQLQEQKVIAG